MAVVTMLAKTAAVGWFRLVCERVSRITWQLHVRQGDLLTTPKNVGAPILSLSRTFAATTNTHSLLHILTGRAKQ